MRTKLATVALAGALGLTGVAGAALLVPAVSYAATGNGTALAERVTSLKEALAGLVTDASGAVLPGVTVEAASPVLIERVRSVVSDGTGRYRIIDLPGGSYTVTFTLTGFSTVQETGIELSGSFAATVNAQIPPLLAPAMARPAASFLRLAVFSTSGRISSSRKRAY